MIKPVRDPLVDVIDNALDQVDHDSAHDLLFSFSLKALEKLYPDFVEDHLPFSKDDLSMLRRQHKGKIPVEVFPFVGSGPGSRKDLVMNLYQAIQENSDIDGIGEQIAWLKEALKREGYSPVVIENVYYYALSEEASR